ncbi:MAG: lytic transglycosylase domain-containing protein [Bdellovibrionales bacterium]|nr:lytic transglycosylase domain-containing protein [Bdellovibrionales bacterium]
MSRRLKVFIFIFVGMAANSSFAATPRTITISTATQMNVLDLSQGDALPASGVPRQMALAKRAYLSSDRANCLKWLKSIPKNAPAVSHWSSLMELECALMGSSPDLKDLNRILGRIKKNSEWFLTGSFSERLKSAFAKGLVVQARLQAKSQRQKAWGVISEALTYQHWMEPEQRADLFALAGEVSFVNQDLVAAKDFFQKSLRIKPSKELQSRMDSIVVALEPKSEAPLVSLALDFQKGPMATEDEQKIYHRMSSAVASKDYISAIGDGVSLLNQFPGGFYSNSVDEQISSLFMGMASGDREKWDQLKPRVLRGLRKASGDRLLSWSQLSFRRGKYRAAYELAETAAEKLEGQESSGRAYSVAAQAARASSELDLAIKNYRVIIEKFTGASYFHESLFSLGLIYFRNEKFSEAVASFEKLLSSQGSESFEYRALYWTWRSLQELKMERASGIQDLLIQKYPMTLYGIQALAEKSGGTIELAPSSPKDRVVKIKLRLFPEELATWERFHLLLKGGWLDEAQAELGSLPPPQTAEEFLVFSKLYADARGYVKSIQMMNEAWDLDPRYAYQKELLKWIFPFSYRSQISLVGKQLGLEPVWIQSLIRQESAFNPRAVSRSNALGLMQLLPGTAQEVATTMKKGELAIPEDLFKPDENVAMGSRYLKKMLSRYEDNLPFALAAYNAGPTRLTRWLNGAQVTLTEDQLWVDELPWSETSFYVKAILRNILIYQLLDQGRLKLTSPIWKISDKGP